MLVKLKNHSGFTLIELTMVMLIVGLVLGGLLVPLSTKLEQESRNRTKDYMNDIKESLIGFSIINGRLPCPDCPDAAIGTCGAGGTANDGMADMSGPAGSQICRTSVGNIPWVDLQVNENDAWGRHLTYGVDTDFADKVDGADGCDTVTVGVSFELCAAGDIDIYNAYAAPYPPSPTIADNVVAVLISHGKNTYNPVQTNVEVENYDRNPINSGTGNNILTAYTAANYTPKIFVMKGYVSDRENSPDAFDDIVMWISPNILIYKMISSGRLP